MKIYFIQYEVRPLPESEDFESSGGAYANCFVQADSEEQATALAGAYFREIDWEIVALEEGPDIIAREEYLEADADWLEAFDLATEEGESYILHMWPNEPQNEDAIH